LQKISRFRYIYQLNYICSLGSPLKDGPFLTAKRGPKAAFKSFVSKPRTRGLGEQRNQGDCMGCIIPTQKVKVKPSAQTPNHHHNTSKECTFNKDQNKEQTGPPVTVQPRKKRNLELIKTNVCGYALRYPGASRGGRKKKPNF